MSKKMTNFHILRTLRIQLKTGYMQREPEAYRFMIRHPPLYRDSKLAFAQNIKASVPYLKYYHQALDVSVFQ